METTITKTKVSFKEVHAEFKRESEFLKKGHDYKGFAQKSDLLIAAGFKNSIATKIYNEISDKADIINGYEKRYFGLQQFILKPQLERICEKYDLYVRDPGFFIGDIPVKNINDMDKFYVYLSDILPQDMNFSNKARGYLSNEDNFILELRSILLQKPNYESLCKSNSITDLWKRAGNMGMRKECEFLSLIVDELRGDIKYNAKIGIRDFPMISKIIGYDLIEIAAVKSLFSEDAFAISNDRIMTVKQVEAKNTVDTDPIVLCKTKHGYLIVTAWGDESNDELVVPRAYN